MYENGRPAVPIFAEELSMLDNCVKEPPGTNLVFHLVSGDIFTVEIAYFFLWFV